MSDNRRDVLRPFEEKRDYMQERIRNGIEHYRKNFVEFAVTDAQGNPVPGAHISLKQKTHDFQYGANLFLLDELESEEKNARYKELFAKNFNMATLPFYWYSLEPEQGKPRYAADSPKYYRRPAPDLCVDWCEKNGVTPKAHCLNYDKYSPRWLPRDLAGVKRFMEKRMRECAERYAARIPCWEVTNETLCGEVDLPERRSTVLNRESDVVEWSFAMARKLFPNNELVINESTDFMWGRFNYNRTPYYMQIERALNNGASIDTIGMQFHMFFPEADEVEKAEPLYDPERIYAVMDRFADFGKPFQITEISIPAYHESEADEDLQAEIIKNLYSMWFSHPMMETITYWNTVDGYAYANPAQNNRDENVYKAGLIRHDMTPKAAWNTIGQLFQKEWHTECETRTNDYGFARARGFHGEYDAEISLGEKNVRRSVHIGAGQIRRVRITL